MVASTLDASLAALAHPSRRAILTYLRRGPARVTTIAAPFKMSLNAVSKHLKVLEQADLVRRQRVGREHLLSLNPEPLKEVAYWLQGYQSLWSHKLDLLEQFFREKKEQE